MQTQNSRIGNLASGLFAMILLWPYLAEAQQQAKIRRIGIVRGDANAPAPSIEIFRQSLQELGYVEDKNIQFEYRYTEGK